METMEVSHPIASLYCDGGVIGQNPSPHGGSWAWVQVAGDGATRLKKACGIVKAPYHGLDTISNNIAELLAAVYGMASLPDGWSGTIYTDSQVTELRIQIRSKDQKPAKMRGVPHQLIREVCQQKERLGNYRVVLLAGHPTVEDMRRGTAREGVPISIHNVLCDRLCSEQARIERRRDLARIEDLWIQQKEFERGKGTTHGGFDCKSV